MYPGAWGESIKFPTGGVNQRPSWFVEWMDVDPAKAGRTMKRLGLWVVVLTLIGAPCGAAPAPPDPALKGWGKPANGLASKIAAEKAEFKVGEKIFLRYQIKNAADEERTVWHSGFWPNHKIVVLDSTGVEVALTPLGRDRRNAFTPGGPRDKNVPMKLAPGDVDDAWVSYDLREMFILDSPGKYTVQYRFEETKGDAVLSNVLEFTLAK
jgi:hypothetical protein